MRNAIILTCYATGTADMFPSSLQCISYIQMVVRPNANDVTIRQLSDAFDTTGVGNMLPDCVNRVSVIKMPIRANTNQSAIT